LIRVEEKIAIIGMIVANIVILIGHVFNLFVSMRRLRDDKPLANSHITKTLQETLGAIIDELRERNQELEAENDRLREQLAEKTENSVEES